MAKGHSCNSCNSWFCGLSPWVGYFAVKLVTCVVPVAVLPR